jgi:tape measure domain-containing protein
MAELEVTIDGRGAQRGAGIVVKGLQNIRKGAEATNASLKRTNRAFRQTSKSSANLGQAIGALGGILAIGKVVAYADAWTLVNNRIRLVTNGTDELNAVTEQVFRIAQEARVGLASTAELYQRIARSAELLGISQQRVLDVTKSVSKAITISGVSATAANAAIVQLGQGLASGTLRGDELRSVLEQTPRLARAIADGLKVPIGALRELGKAGKLSAQDVIAALESQKDVLDKEFGSIDVTIGQAFVTLESSLIRFVGRFGEATGFFKEGARSIQLIGTSLDNVSDSFFDGAFAFSQFISALAGGFSVLDEQFALFQNTVLTTLTETFQKSKKLAEESVFFQFSPVGAATGLIDALFGGDIDSLTAAAADERTRLTEELRRANEVVAEGLDAQRVLFEENRARRKAAADLDLSEDPDPSNMANRLTERQVAAAERLRKSLEKLGETLTASLRTPLEEFETSLAQANRLLDAGVISTETYQRNLAALTETYREQLPAVIEYNDQLERGVSITEEFLTPQEIFIERQRELNELLGVGAINQETFNRALVAAQEELGEAVGKNSEFAGFLEQISIQAARNMQSAFADFLFDPFDEGMEGLLNNFVDVLRRLAAEALSAEVFKILGDGFESLTGGGGGGGGFDLAGFFSGILTAQSGGDFPGGRPILVGEEGPEIIQPRGPTTITPTGGMGQMAAPEVTVPVSITNITDPSAIVSAIESSGGQQAIVNAIAQNPDAIKRALN